MSRTVVGRAEAYAVSQVEGYQHIYPRVDPFQTALPSTSAEVLVDEDLEYAETMRTRRRTLVGIAAAVGAGVAVALGNIDSSNQHETPVPAIYPQIAHNNGELPPAHVPQQYGPADTSQFTGGR